MNIADALKIATSKHPGVKFDNCLVYSDKFIFATKSDDDDINGFEVTINSSGEEERFGTVNIVFDDPDWLSANKPVDLSEYKES